MQSDNPLICRSQRLLLFICAATVLATGQIFAADGTEQKKPTTGGALRKSYGAPYCGLYCLYTAMKLAGRRIDFRELVKYDYLSSWQGSSLTELKRCAEDFGLYAMPAGKLTIGELSQLDYPVILHVKRKISFGQYDHYELFLGTENDKARLFDPPDAIRLVPFPELAPRWDGKGLIVSAEPIDPRLVFGPGRKRLLVYMAIAIAAILCLHWAKRLLPKTLLNSHSKWFGLSMGQGAAFAIVALLCGMLYHFSNDAGLLSNANATAAIQHAHAGNFIPKISEKKVHKLLGTDTIFIDARLARDYEAGHLERAISVPVDANDVERKIAMADISKDARIVTYCQSSGCKYAEVVAIKLKDSGFSNISIFRGGWFEWKASNNSAVDSSG